MLSMDSLDRIKGLIRNLLTRVGVIEARIPTTGTTGSVPFWSGGALSQANAAFFWNSTFNRLGVGAGGAPYTAATNAKSIVVDQMSFIGDGNVVRGIAGCPTWDTSYFGFQNGILAETIQNGAFYQNSNGLTVVNAASGQTLHLRIANGNYFTLSATSGYRFQNGDIRLDQKLGIGQAASANSPLAITGLPTSSAGLATGDVWNNSGVLTIV